MSRPLVLITGGAGFIGSNIAARLCAQGEYEVVVCDRLRAAADGKCKNIAKHGVSDFVAPEALFDWLESSKRHLDGIIHMGAISSTTEPDADRILHANFTLSRDLWDWCSLRAKRFVYASSAATYGDGAQGFSDADDEARLLSLRPLNAYGYSKALFDLYARRAAERGEQPPSWAGLKFFNVYGPNEYHKGSMKSVVAQVWPKIRDGEPVKLFRSHRNDYPDGGQLRDFVHVDDAVSMVLWMFEHQELAGIYNCGTGQARSFEDLATAAYNAVDRLPAIEYVDMPEAIRPNYQYFTEADLMRVRAAGSDRPFVTLEDGVHDYVAGFLAQADPYR